MYIVLGPVALDCCASRARENECFGKCKAAPNRSTVLYCRPVMQKVRRQLMRLMRQAGALFVGLYCIILQYHVLYCIMVLLPVVIQRTPVLSLKIISLADVYHLRQLSCAQELAAKSAARDLLIYCMLTN